MMIVGDDQLRGRKGKKEKKGENELRERSDESTASSSESVIVRASVDEYIATRVVVSIV